MQSSSSGRPFKPGLVGASPTTDANLWLNANCPRSSDRLERRSAKAEVAGAIPAVDAISQDCGVTSSISPCEGDGPGANPGFLTIPESCSAHICSYCTNVGAMVNSFKAAENMSRISIDVSDQEHKKLKALAALRGQSIKDFVLERALGGDEAETAALKELRAPMKSQQVIRPPNRGY